MLVGGSSTGKTRACWEALALLRNQDPLWRLWHPIDPSRPDAALRELPGIGPRTVVWLNEAQFYLDPADAGLGERVAAGLRELLRDPGRAPVLVLATVWPRFWDALTTRPLDAAPGAVIVDGTNAVDTTKVTVLLNGLPKAIDDRWKPRWTTGATSFHNGQILPTPRVICRASSYVLQGRVASIPSIA